MTGVGGTTRHKPRGFGRWSLHGDTDSANLHLCSDAPEIRSRRRFPLPRPACRRRGLRLTQSGGLLATLLSLPVDLIKKIIYIYIYIICSHGLKKITCSYLSIQEFLVYFQLQVILLKGLFPTAATSGSESLRASIRQLVTSSTSVGFFRPV